MKPEFIICDQGGTEWQNLKLGVPSASNASKVLAKKGTETRNGYIMELVGQIATRYFDEVSAKTLEYGKLNEPAARAAYEFDTGNKVDQVGVIYGLNKRVLASADGHTPPIRKGQEFKCPMTARVHADFLCNEKVKPEYVYQVQWGLWVAQYETWDFASFHPLFDKHKLAIKTFEKDPKTFERFENEVPEFLKEMDEALAKIGLVYGEQWV